jgi:hypothetical protein
MAAVPFEYGCNVAGAFVTDPNGPPVGWVTVLDGFGLAAGSVKADLTVTQPLTGGTTSVVGVLEKFAWGGGVGDRWNSFFMSHKRTRPRSRRCSRRYSKTPL